MKQKTLDGKVIDATPQQRLTPTQHGLATQHAKLVRRYCCTEMTEKERKELEEHLMCLERLIRKSWD